MIGKQFVCVLCASFFLVSGIAVGEDMALTVYDKGFVVVREQIPLDLSPGVNALSHGLFSPLIDRGSVMITFPDNQLGARLLEKRVILRSASEHELLANYVGQTVSFEVSGKPGEPTIVQGRLLEYVPPMPSYDSAHSMTNWAYSSSYGRANAAVLIDVDGVLHNAFPGKPLLPPREGAPEQLPALKYTVQCDAGGKTTAHLTYVMYGLAWRPEYRIILSSQNSHAQFLGAYCIENRSGKPITGSSLCLALIPEVTPRNRMEEAYRQQHEGPARIFPTGEEQVRLYDIGHAVTLDAFDSREYEFMRFEGEAKPVFTYDGGKPKDGEREYYRDDSQWIDQRAVQASERVSMSWEIANTQDAGLGVSLPEGRLRVYVDDGTHVAFMSERVVERAEPGDSLLLDLGAAAGLHAARRSLGLEIKTLQNSPVSEPEKGGQEKIEITLANRRGEGVEIRVIEHMYRAPKWSITDNSAMFAQQGPDAVEFRVSLNPGEEKVLSYTVTYKE